jgi:hypothetical protein
MKIVGQAADMSPHPDLPSRTSATRSALARDAGLLRIRSATKAITAAAALGSVALGLTFAQSWSAQAASSPTTAASQQSTQAPAAPTPSDQQQQLAPPAQPPAQVAPQVQPQAVSGGS